MPGGAPASGWTLYPPLVLQTGEAFPIAIFAIHLMGASSIMGAINVIVTIMNMRAPGMTLLKMPLFSWSWLITAYLLIAVMPVLAGAVTMLLTDHFFGTSFFNAAGGGDPVLFQHVFWFFGHPEVYIMILPAFGIVSEIIPTFSRKPMFGYEAMVYAIASIAFLSFIVWAHHMFTVGMPLAGQLFFMLSTMLIAVPTGVKIFNWTATMWRGSLTFEPPMLFALAFLFLFTIGGFSGLMLAIVPADFQYHDTYFVVAHFHYVLVPGSVFALMAAVYYWLPKWTGHMYDMTLAKWHFWLSAIFVNVLFFPQHFLGPRRHAAPHPRLRHAVRRLEHGLLDRRLRLRPVAAPVRLADREVHPRRRARDGAASGTAARASSGPCRRRRRTTPSRRRRRSIDRAVRRTSASRSRSAPWPSPCTSTYIATARDGARRSERREPASAIAASRRGCVLWPRAASPSASRSCRSTTCSARSRASAARDS